jgi:hypothetical protein
MGVRSLICLLAGIGTGSSGIFPLIIGLPVFAVVVIWNIIVLIRRVRKRIAKDDEQFTNKKL